MLLLQPFGKTIIRFSFIPNIPYRKVGKVA